MSAVTSNGPFEQWQFEYTDDDGHEVYSSIWIPSDLERKQVAQGYNLRLRIRLPEEEFDLSSPSFSSPASNGNGNGHHEPEPGVSYDVDQKGAPIMLARAPGQVADQGAGSGAIVYRGGKGGNPNFDPLTGKFAGNKAKKLQVVAQAIQAGAPPLRSGVPSGVDPTVWERRMDAVRDAARQMKEMDVNALQGFLKGRVVDVSAVDLNQFQADVRAQRISDLADVLDQSVQARSKNLPVKVVAPNRWTKQVFRDLTGPEALQVVKRLEGRNWDPVDIKKYVIKRITNVDIRNALEQAYGEPEPKSGKKIPAKEGGTGA